MYPYCTHNLVGGAKGKKGLRKLFTTRLVTHTKLLYVNWCGAGKKVGFFYFLPKTEREGNDDDVELLDGVTFSRFADLWCQTAAADRRPGALGPSSRCSQPWVTRAFPIRTKLAAVLNLCTHEEVYVVLFFKVIETRIKIAIFSVCILQWHIQAFGRYEFRPYFESWKI